MTFLEHLAQKNIIKEEDIPAILQAVAESGSAVEKVLLERGLDENNIMGEKSEYLNVPLKELDGEAVPFKTLEYIPEESAAYYKFVPLGVKDGVLEVGLADPENIEARDALQFISARVNMPVKVFLISQKDFEDTVKNYKGFKGEVTQALSEIETDIKDTEGVEIVEEKEDGATDGKETQIKEEAPVTKITAVIIRHATEGGASDVHIEHMGDKVRVRFRVDGALYTSLVLPVAVHSAVVARIKILSKLKLDIKRKPQDGRFSARIEGRKIDFRVSTFPAYYGEKVVMRILDSEKGLKELDKIGMSTKRVEMIRDAITRPYGLILVTGPTGSGKTTTLYSMLNELDKEGSNVVSLEDPVEYKMAGVSQSQVRPEIGYTFANGLRSILRQDPDVIMVGEIRDKETAALAIQASLTGHLVFSTLHTNNAMGAIPRLIDMGIDPYLIAPTLILVVGQRLAKTLCPDSKKAVPINESIRIMLDKQFADLPEAFKSDIIRGESFYEPVISPQCPGGTAGRTAVFEVLQVDDAMEQVILQNPVETEIWKVARGNGMLNMKEDAIMRAFEGEIPFGEVNAL